jgi:hypothetical protein
MRGQVSRGQKRSPVNLTTPESLLMPSGVTGVDLGLHHLRFYHLWFFMAHHPVHRCRRLPGNLSLGSFCNPVNVNDLSGSSDGCS